ATCDFVVRVQAIESVRIFGDLIIQASAGSFAVPVRAQGEALALSRVAPKWAAVNGGSVLTVYGSGFTRDSEILLDGDLVSPVEVVSNNQLKFVAPAHPHGTVSVSVLTANRTYTASLPNALNFIDTPVIDTLSPDAGTVEGGWSVAITGSGFIPGMTVAVEGLPASKVEVSSENEGSFTVPERARIEEGPVDVSATTLIGSV